MHRHLRRAIAVVALLSTLVAPAALVAETPSGPPEADETPIYAFDLLGMLAEIWQVLLDDPEPNNDPISSEADGPDFDPDAGPVIDPAG